MAEASVFELRCEVMKYAWGKLGVTSEVARLSNAANPDFIVADCDPYAELWMGSHPKAPSKIAGKETSLLEYVSENPQVLGRKVLERFKGELPYLFKVLSVNKSLSIQAHPNKKHAEKLNKERPDIYKDSNHKPEMAIALTPFEGMCGFRPLTEIQGFLRCVPEFYNVIGKEASEKLLQCTPGSEEVPSCLRACFENVMTCSTEVRERNIADLVDRLSEMDRASPEFAESNGELLLRLNSQFPGDVGCFVIYFLNQILLQPGQAMFLGANEPHAYLNGNCIECMACSDNVVRAGLTPKLIDVPTLCEMLNYEPASPKSKIFPAVSSSKDPYLTIYNPPVDDFAVHKIEVSCQIGQYTLACEESASILLIIDGYGESYDAAKMSVRPGAVFFMVSNAKLTLNLSGI